MYAVILKSTSSLIVLPVTVIEHSIIVAFHRLLIYFSAFSPASSGSSSHPQIMASLILPHDPLISSYILQIYTYASAYNFPGMKAMCFDRVKGILLSTYGYSDPILLHFMNVSFIDTAGKYMQISRLERIEPPKEIAPRELILELLRLAMLGAALLLPLFVRFRRKQLMEARTDNKTAILVNTLSVFGATCR